MTASSDFVAVKVPPGFFRNGTNYQAKGRWYDGSLVRWANGRIEPVGGCVSLLSGGATLSGVPRNILNWFDNSGFRYTAVGTNTKLYVSQNGGTFDDASPVGLVAGRADSIEGQGYGAGPYGQGNYGEPAASGTLGLELQAASWDFDTFGQLLLGVLDSDGKIYQWNPATGGAATVIDATAPTNCCGVLVTNEQYIIALGAGGNRRTIQWPDEGTLSGWTVTSTGTAGSRQLQTSGQILRAAIVGTQYLVWTTNDVHLLEFTGPPAIYANFRIADKCGLMGPRAVGTRDQGVAEWMGNGAFFLYNGVVQRIPCEVEDYVFGNFNFLQRAKVFACTCQQFKETTWYYCSANSTEIDSYVTHNYDLGTYGRDIWYFGKYARTCRIDAGVFDAPFSCDPSGHVFQEETGWTANGASRNGSVYLTSGPAEIGNGKRVIKTVTMVPDVEITPTALQLTITTKNSPQGPTLVTNGPLSLVPNSRGIVPCRATGRQAALAYSQVQDAQWSLGTLRFDPAAGGKG